jgi:hypothetical protein
MKKIEGVPISEEIEKQFGLSKYRKDEFTKEILKEFSKHGKKLQKVAAYEKMEKEGKPLNQEMRELVNKKIQMIDHLTSLKQALELYEKSFSAPASGEQKPVAEPQKPQESMAFDSEVAKKLGYFFAVASTLTEQEKAYPNPLEALSPNEKHIICKLYKEITEIPEGKETSLMEEAKHFGSWIEKLLKKSTEEVEHNVSFAKLSESIEKILGDKAKSEKKYKMTKPMQMPKPVPVPVPAPQEEPKKEVKPAPAPAPVQAPVTAPVQEPVKKEEKHSNWADEEEDEEEDKNELAKEEKPVEEPEQEDEGFTVVKSKEEERKERMAGGYRRRRGGYRYRGEFRGERRGEFRGERRGGRGERRGGRGRGRGEEKGEAKPEAQAGQQ